MKKKILLFAVCLLTVNMSLRADEGMWLLPYLQKLNYEDMKAKGLKLKPQDIYNAKGSSLKDAIVIFGRGCTGEIVSPEGLLFTNHHCGYDAIQLLSSVENDYLARGFWAMDRSEELPVPGLSVQFIRHIEDVTDIIVNGVTGNMTFIEEAEHQNENIKSLIKEMEGKYPDMAIEVKPFFGGNQFFMFVKEVFKDVRLAGAPPASIGKFGGETDNWMWPRHTGDFAVFRVYSAPDGSAAEYSRDNVPYKSPVHLKISAKGYDEGDFAMVMGFPGTTTRYMTTYEIDEMLDVSNPNRIYIRGERQNILKKQMEKSDKVRIQYASKYASSSNYWKNSIGMSKAIKELKVRDFKEANEHDFADWAAADPSRARYARALPLIKQSQDASVELWGYLQIISETTLRSIDIARIANTAERRMAAVMEKSPEEFRSFSEELYKDYDEETERLVTKRMLEILMDMLPEEHYPEFVITDINGRFSGDVTAYTDWLYDTSVFANKEKFDAFAAEFDVDRITSDPAYVMSATITDKVGALRTEAAKHGDKFYEGHRAYIAGLMEKDPQAKHYPDANFTIRLTYGQVLPYSPADGVDYKYYTTLKGVMEKEDENNPTEFTVPARLKELYYAEDYGRYADFTDVSKKEKKNGAKGHINTCFLSNNDITGGNSGSPVLNAYGELIGLAFDGNWEAMSGDVVFEQNMQRCINVDVRYVLFVIDKFAGAGHLLDEMTIIW